MEWGGTHLPPLGPDEADKHLYHLISDHIKNVVIVSEYLTQRLSGQQPSPEELLQLRHEAHAVLFVLRVATQHVAREAHA